MRITFRQGIVRHQTDTLGNPTFLDLSAGKVSLIVSPDPTIITFANGLTTNYLYTESNTVTNAWPGALQPSNQTTIATFSAGTDYWLYWDINRTTGLRAFGHTLLAPVASATPPSNPQTDQHWFDTSRRIMMVRESNRWVEKIRVFAAKLQQGAVLLSISANAPLFTGTQVGLNVPGFAGSLVFDKVGKPLKTSENKFFTTEDIFLSGIPTGTEAKINAVLVTAEAQQPMSAYTVVQFSNLNRVVPATPFTSADAVWGIIEEDVVTGDPVRVVTEGIIRNAAWDFTSAGVNALVYFNGSGQVTTSQVIPSQFPIGFVIDKNAIVLRQPRTTIIGGQDVDKATNTVYGISRLSLAAVNPADPIVVGDNDPRLDPFDLTVGAVSNVDTITFNAGDGFSVVDLTGGAVRVDLSVSGGGGDGAGSPIPLYPGDNVSELVNDAGYITSFSLGSPLPLYPGDNVSELVNDAGYLTSLGSPQPLTSVALDDLTDVSVPSPSNGEVLTFTGTQWEAQAVASGGAIIYGGVDISAVSGGSPLGTVVNIDYPLDEAPDGSVSAPTYSFLNETDSGWYRDDLQTVCLSVGGENSICVINRDGSPALAVGSPDALVGIGIDLHVLNDGSGDSQIRIETDAASTNAQIKLITPNGEWAIVNDSSDDDLHFLWNDTDRFVMTDNPQLLGTDGAVGAPTYSFINDGDTGAYLISDGEYGITTAGVERVSVNATRTEVAGVVYGPNGSTSAPTYSFTDDPNTGIWRSDVDTLNISVGGTERLEIDNTAINATVPIETTAQVRTAFGNETTPAHSFRTDTDSGMWLSSPGILNISTDGVERLEIDSTSIDATVPYRGANGSAGTPTYSFTGDTGVGLYLPSSDTLGFVTGSVEKFRLLPTGVLRSTVSNYGLLLSNDNDIPNKGYVDSLAAGLDPKESVRVATLASNTGSPQGSPVVTGDLTESPYGGTYIIGTGSPPSVGSPTVNSGSFVGVDLTEAIDGVVVTVGDRVLVKNQTDPTQNGIYVVTTAGVSGELDRATDQDGTPANEVSGGNFTFVESGSQAGSIWTVVWDGEVTLNTDPVNWTQVGGAVVGTTPALGGLTDVTDSLGPSGKINNNLYAFEGNGSGSLDVIDLSAGSPNPLAEVLDDIYLRLDTTNDPLTGTLTINGEGSPQLAVVANGDVVVNSQVRVSDGSVLTPTYSFSGESNTGWYRPDTTTVGLAIAGEESIIVVKPSTGSPSTALGSPEQYDLSVGIEMRLKNDADGDSRLVLETDAIGYNAVLSLVTANSTWSVSNNVSGGSPSLGTDSLIIAKDGDAVAVIEDAGTPVYIRNHFYREGISVTGSPLEVVVTHSLGEQFVIVQVYDDSTPPQQVDPGTIELVDANSVRLTFSTTFTGTVVISG